VSERAGNLLIAAGVVLVVVGVVARLGLLSWFGRLPGDIRIEGESSSFFFPITSMVIVSVVGSIILYLVRR
jgi:hypothetical protein